MCFAVLEARAQDTPGRVRLAQRGFLGIEVPVRAVQVPIRNFDVRDHLLHEPLEVGARLVEAKPRDQDALGRRLRVEGPAVENAARVRRSYLVDLNAEAL